MLPSPPKFTVPVLEQSSLAELVSLKSFNGASEPWQEESPFTTNTSQPNDNDNLMII
jgi:hypothetical protein